MLHGVIRGNGMSYDRPEFGDWIDRPVWTKEALAESERIQAERKLKELRDRIVEQQLEHWGACGLSPAHHAVLEFYARALSGDA